MKKGRVTEGGTGGSKHFLDFWEKKKKGGVSNPFFPQNKKSKKKSFNYFPNGACFKIWLRISELSEKGGGAIQSNKSFLTFHIFFIKNKNGPSGVPNPRVFLK